MSTILDALRKAQEETGSERRGRVDALPDAGGDGSPPRRGPRRALAWLATALGVVALAFIGTLALGDRVSGLFGRVPETVDDSAQLAAEDGRAMTETVAAEPGLPAEAKQRSAPVDAEPQDKPAASQLAAARPRRQAAAARAARRDAEPVPTPAGQLQVFKADELGRASQGDSDRAERLQQLRERMLKARQEAAARSAARVDKPPVPIIVPPPPQPADEAGAVATAPRSDAVAAEAQAVVDAAAAAQAVAEAALRNEAADVAASAPAEDHGAPAPAPFGLAADPDAAGVGVSVRGAHQEADEGEIHDPAAALPDRAARPVTAEEPPTAVAALTPPQPAAAAAQPPVLRRSPGDAPQVSINILQWSTEPGRRFAFVSIDGGGMTQVREGDRIGGLTVKHIHQQMIEFGYNESSFLLRAN